MNATERMALWDAVRTPDPSATKAFSRTGGFKGTATNAVYLIQRATEMWGPMGSQWGVEIVDDRIIDGAPLLGKDGGVIGCEKVHVLRINLRHPGGVVPGYGQTMLVGTNKYGPYTDEEAPKKSLTDALTKALSWLGFAADIHLGRWDDVKYVSTVKHKFARGGAGATQEPGAEAAGRVVEPPPEPQRAPRISATSAAGSSLSEARRGELDAAALFMIEEHQAGRDVAAINLWYDPGTFAEDDDPNDARMYLWNNLRAEARLRATIKASNPKAPARAA